MATKRQRQVAELLHEEISQLIQYDLQDPRLGFVTVTGVDVTADLRLARVYISVLGDETDTRETLKSLAGAAGYLRHRLKEFVSLRYIPELSFKIDTSLEQGLRVDQLLEVIKHETEQPQNVEPELDE